MPFLLRNSDTNYESAEVLWDDKKYCAVPHCAYYSCVQMMKHILLEMGYTSNQMDNERKQMSIKASRFVGVHEYIIDTIKQHGKGLVSDYALRRIFDTDINSLKSIRVSADYENKEVTSEIAEGTIVLSNNIRSYLKDYYIATV
jgi:uncharacterized protein (UPF0332 family)